MFPTKKIKLLRSQAQGKTVQFTEDQCLVLISCMFMCIMPQNEKQHCTKFHKVKLPKSNTFISMLTRDLEDPSKDGIKTRKIEFLFNYFDIELQKSKMPPAAINNAKIDIYRLVLPSDNYTKLNSKFWR